MSRLRLAGAATVVVLVLLGLHQLVYAFMSRTRAPELSRLGRVPDFAFTSEKGTRVDAGDLEGKTWIADFIFLRCGGFCPMMSERMAALGKSLEGEPSIRFVSFDVDPEHDAVTDLAAYARTHGADPARWTFLRGDRPSVRTLAAEGFKLAVVDGHADDPEPILHSSHFVLVDARRQIRGYYDGLEPAGIERLLADARRLARD